MSAPEFDDLAVCSECGVSNDTVKGATKEWRAGTMLGYFCPQCAAREGYTFP